VRLRIARRACKRAVAALILAKIGQRDKHLRE